MSTRLFPQAEFAEDQAYGHALLTTHVLHRGFTAGAVVGSAIAPAVFGYRLRRYNQAVSSGVASAGTLTRPGFAPILLRSAGRGTVVGTALMGVALYGRMRGREEIEWKDRSWRLLANEGQVLVDDFSIAGAAAGLATALRPGALDVGWRGPLARAGLGSMAGTAAYVVFQYGIRPAMRKDEGEKA